MSATSVNQKLVSVTHFCDDIHLGAFRADIEIYFAVSFLPQNSDSAAVFGNLPNVPEVDSSSSVQPSSASESCGLPAVENTAPLSQSAVSSAVTSGLSMCQQLTRIASQMEELVNASVTDLTTGTPLSSRIVDELLELKNDVESLTSCSAAKQCTSGSDSGHDDSNSLPPELSGDVAGDNVDADVPQQHSTDALDSSDNAAAESSATGSREASGFVEHVACKARQVYCAIVRPFRTAAASNVPEFTAQGNLMLCCLFFSLSCL